MSELADARRIRRIATARRRIQAIVEKLEALAGELETVQEGLEIPDLAELQEIAEGRRPWSYETLLLALLQAMAFHLAEVTVTCWRESFAGYPPSKLKADIHDPFLSQNLRNWIERRIRDRQKLRDERNG